MDSPQDKLPLKVICLGRGNLNFFGGCVPHRFPKVGFSKWISLKMRSHGNKKFGNLHLERRNFGQNKAEYAGFSWNWKWRDTWAAHWGKIGRLWSADWPDKKGVMTAAHPSTRIVNSQDDDQYFRNNETGIKCFRIRKIHRPHVRRNSLFGMKIIRRNTIATSTSNLFCLHW